jgi:hypothetical protein
MKIARMPFTLPALAAALVWGCASGGGTTSSAGTTTTTASAPATTTPPAAGTTTTTTSSTAGTTAGVASTVAGAAGALGLTDTLGKSFGLTGDQASGAVGSVLSMAQTKLPASDYSQVAAAVPGAEGYVQKAKDLGAVTGPVSDMSGLNAAYAKLGINPAIGSQVTSAITGYVSKVNPTIGSVLSGVVK